MSLMNDVLQQLDARHPEETTLSRIAPPLFVNSGVMQTLPWGKLVLAAVCMGIGFSAAKYGNVNMGEFASIGNIATSASVVDVLPTLESSPILESTLEKPLEPTLNNASLVQEKTADPAVVLQLDSVPIIDEQSFQINQLLQEANALLVADKLMQPLGNNAFVKFRQILLMDNGNAAAVEGIEAIKSRYKTLFNTAMAAGNLEKAKSYLERMSVAGVEPQQLQSMAEDLRSKLVENKLVENQLVEKPLDVESPIGLTAVQPTEVASSQLETNIDDGLQLPSHNSVASVPLNTDVAPNLRTLGDSAQEDKQLARLALSGKLLKAKYRLRDFIATHSSTPESQFALGQLYADEKNSLELTQLLMQGSELSPSRKMFLQAKLAINLGDFTGAANLLMNSEAEASFLTEHQRLLAVAFQNTQQYEKAIVLYQQLLKHQQQNANLWLGLGVCEDALGHGSVALEAFNRSYALGGHSAHVLDYLRGRIGALSS